MPRDIQQMAFAVPIFNEGFAATYRVSKGEWSGAEIFKEKFNSLDRVCEAVKGLVQLYHYESQQTLYSLASSTVG